MTKAEIDQWVEDHIKGQDRSRPAIEEWGKIIAHHFYEAAKKELGWISVKERLPEEFGRYYTCQDIGGEPRSVMTMLFDDGKWYDGDGYRHRIIDYWMPIPELPKEK